MSAVRGPHREDAQPPEAAAPLLHGAEGLHGTYNLPLITEGKKVRWKEMSCATDLEESGGAGGRKAPGEKCELRAGQRAAVVLMPSRCGAVTLRC